MRSTGTKRVGSLSWLVGRRSTLGPLFRTSASTVFEPRVYARWLAWSLERGRASYLLRYRFSRGRKRPSLRKRGATQVQIAAIRVLHLVRRVCSRATVGQQSTEDAPHTGHVDAPRVRLFSRRAEPHPLGSNLLELWSNVPILRESACREVQLSPSVRSQLLVLVITLANVSFHTSISRSR